MGCALSCFSCCIACCVGPKMMQGKDLKSLTEYSQSLNRHLGNQPFFGGSGPSITDVSLYGAIAPFKLAGAPCVNTLLGDHLNPLHKWFDAMESTAAGIKVL